MGRGNWFPNCYDKDDMFYGACSYFYVDKIDFEEWKAEYTKCLVDEGEPIPSDDALREYHNEADCEYIVDDILVTVLGRDWAGRYTMWPKKDLTQIERFTENVVGARHVCARNNVHVLLKDEGEHWVVVTLHHKPYWSMNHGDLQYYFASKDHLFHKEVEKIMRVVGRSCYRVEDKLLRMFTEGASGYKRTCRVRTSPWTSAPIDFDLGRPEPPTWMGGKTTWVESEGGAFKRVRRWLDKLTKSGQLRFTGTTWYTKLDTVIAIESVVRIAGKDMTQIELRV